jgi:hypothetical protein
MCFGVVTSLLQSHACISAPFRTALMIRSNGIKNIHGSGRTNSPGYIFDFLDPLVIRHSLLFLSVG